MEKDLVAARVMCEAAEKEATPQLEQTKTLTVNATSHAHKELMDEYEAGQQAKWDLDYEIEVWCDRELELAGGKVEVEAVPL